MLQSLNRFALIIAIAVTAATVATMVIAVIVTFVIIVAIVHPMNRSGFSPPNLECLPNNRIRARISFTDYSTGAALLSHLSCFFTSILLTEFIRKLAGCVVRESRVLPILLRLHNITHFCHYSIGFSSDFVIIRLYKKRLRMSITFIDI